MNLKKLLQEQGNYYGNLTSNETIQKYNKTFEPQGFIQYKVYSHQEKEYKTFSISKQEHEAIKELEKLLGKEPVLSKYGTSFEIFIKNKRITHLAIEGTDLAYIPERINNLTNLRRLALPCNQIQEIKNLDNLQNLEVLFLYNNKIKEIKGLDNLTKLRLLSLSINEIKEIKGLDNLTNIQELNLDDNKITEMKGIYNLQKLKIISFRKNSIPSKREIVENLKNKGVIVWT